MRDFKLSTKSVFCRQASSGLSLNGTSKEEAMEETSKDQCALEMPVISSYSRKQAIEDGVLVDVTETAREAGIR